MWNIYASTRLIAQWRLMPFGTPRFGDTLLISDRSWVVIGGNAETKRVEVQLADRR